MPPKDKVELIYDEVVTIKELLTGNGEPSKGLIVRVDRLEQAEQKRGVWVGAAVVAGVGAAVTTVWAKLTGGQ